MRQPRLNPAARQLEAWGNSRSLSGTRMAIMRPSPPPAARPSEEPQPGRRGGRLRRSRPRRECPVICQGGSVASRFTTWCRSQTAAGTARPPRREGLGASRLGGRPREPQLWGRSPCLVEASPLRGALIRRVRPPANQSARRRRRPRRRRSRGSRLGDDPESLSRRRRTQRTRPSGLGIRRNNALWLPDEHRLRTVDYRDVAETPLMRLSVDSKRSVSSSRIRASRGGERSSTL